jgi:hypothetical protein
MLDFEIAFAIKQEFDEMLDECYPTVELGGITNCKRVRPNRLSCLAF